ncbi:MAG: MFS transporter [Scytolyngbya sp. HA4215-MV1]|nr:MFS transporter [Scytolyngbya sp. HA4215-MV1]
MTLQSTLASLYSLMHRWGLAQFQGGAEPITPETTSVLISSPKFFIALISGVLLAFAIQLLLTNFSFAAGISYLGHSSSSDDDSSDEDSGISIRKIGAGLGTWTLISVTIALFFACYLAVQLSLLNSMGLGAIVGLVIWAAYFSLLVWFGSSAVGSLVGSVINTATSGFQAVFGTATAVIGSQNAKKQIVSTAEAITAAVRNELGSAVDPTSIRESVESYVQRLQLPSFDMTQIRRDFEGLLNDPEIAALADTDHLRHIDRNTFIDLVSKRTDFTRSEVERFADLLEGIWRQTLGQRSRRNSTAEFIEYLQSTEPGKLQIQELNTKLDRLLAERSQQTGAKSEEPTGLLQQTLQFGMNTVLGLIVGRTDLSDLDVEQVLDRLKSAPGQVSEKANKVVAQLKGERSETDAYHPIRTDVENYLLNKYSWQMSPAVVNREFRELLYDPKADPGSIAEQLSQLNRSYFVKILADRGVFTQAKIQQLADQLESIRQEVLAGAIAAHEIERQTDLRQRVERYLTLTPKNELFSDDSLPAFKDLLGDETADEATLSQRLSSYNRFALQEILAQRTDLTPEETAQILNTLETTRDRVLFESKTAAEQVNQKLTEFQNNLQSYLRNTGKAELNPDGIKRDMKLLLDDPKLGLEAFRYRVSHFDRDTVVQLLRQRDDISEAEANQIVDEVESSWSTFVNSPRILVSAAKDKYDQTLTTLADYLRQTNLEELNPEGIQRDLSKLLEDPQEGSAALQRRISKIDRETLVRLLSQRQDLSEAQVNRAIDQVQSAIHQIVRAPRRLALRTQQSVVDFESTLEDYLRNTDKEELNPEGIKRDLNLLIHSPRYGLKNLGDRLSQFDRSTIIALLSQREDMTEAEAEHIVAQVESVRDQILGQMQQVQSKIQAIIDRIFANIRNYLNSLNRPELNYDSLKQDIRTLFDDPQAGFEALRDRLSQFDRQTLVAILSSREDISAADVNRVIDQIESVRSNVLQRAERIQTEAQRRLEAVKLQAQHQMEETRKAAATAAWWLFATALVSAIAAAGGGALAAS